jgi:hypothetical protein
VKTRTLLLLALACGMAIMLAGAVLLFQLSTQDDVAPPVALGDVAHVADMRVAVVDVGEADGSLAVTVQIGGVDDPQVTDGFRLIASGRAVSPESDGDGCEAVTVAEQTCVIRFDVSGADGSSRVLFYERGDQRARWVLA